MVLEARRRRVYNAQYDTVVQKSRLQPLLALKPSPLQLEALCRTALVGQMRLDLALSGELVLTQTQILDGALFLRADPRRLMSEVSTSPDENTAPIRARSVSGQLSTDVLTLIADADGHHKPFRFSVLGDLEDRTLHGYLAEMRTLPGALDHTDVVAHMRRAGIDAETCDVVSQGWTAWASSDLPVEHFDHRRSPAPYGFAIDRARILWRDLALSDDPTTDAYDEVKSFLTVQLTSSPAPTRTKMYDTIDKHPGLSAQSRPLLREWLDSVYNLAFARQHECEDFEQLKRAAFRPVDSTSAESKGTSRLASDLDFCSVEVPSDFLLRLGVLATDEWQGWLQTNDQLLASWRDEEPSMGASISTAFDDLNNLLRGVSPAAVSIHLGGIEAASVPQHFRERRYVGYAGTALLTPIVQELLQEHVAAELHVPLITLTIVVAAVDLVRQWSHVPLSNGSIASDVATFRKESLAG